MLESFHNVLSAYNSKRNSFALVDLFTCMFLLFYEYLCQEQDGSNILWSNRITSNSFNFSTIKYRAWYFVNIDKSQN